MRAAVVIPTYQEALNIAGILARVRSSLPDADVLVVDDNSPDGTAAIAERVGSELGRIHVLVRPTREGLGPAYRAGWRWALERGYEAVIDMDADGSHDPSALPVLLDRLVDGADLAMGSRYIPGGSVPGWAAHRLLLSKGGNWYAMWALGLPVHDATGGYRAYRTELLRKIDLSTLRANGYAFQIELAYRSLRLGANVVEVPITFIDRTQGTSKMHAAIILEALWLVTGWAIRERVLSRGRRR